MARKRRHGRKPTPVTDTNVAAVSRIVDADLRVTYQQMEPQWDIGSPAVKCISKDRLSLKKLCSWWVAHDLTVEHNTTRRDFAQGMLERCAKNPNGRLIEMVTGDKTWTYYYEPLPKLQSVDRIRPEQPRPKKNSPFSQWKEAYTRSFLELLRRHVLIKTCFHGKKGPFVTAAVYSKKVWSYYYRRSHKVTWTLAS